MKTRLPSSVMKVIMALLLLFSFNGMSQTDLAIWTFDILPGNPNTPTSIAANLGPQAGTAYFYADGTNGSTTWNTNWLDSGNGTVNNYPPPGPAIPGNALRLNPGGALGANGRQWVLKASMTGYEDPELTFALHGTAGSFDHQWAWSTDGTTFTNFGINTNNTAGNYQLRSLDMSAIDQLDNATTIYLRLTVSGATVNTGRNRFDNITLSASEQTPTFGTITQAAVACSGLPSQFNITGLLPSSTSTIFYNINAGPTQNVTNVVSDALGDATMDIILAPANNGQVLTVTGVQRTDHPTPQEPVTSGNTVNLAVTPSVTYYADSDTDGYGDPDAPMLSCDGLPAGHVTNNTDCDDTNPDVNPAQTEILYNGIDDNCDGNMDEGFQLKTQVKANQCGTTLNLIYTAISAQVNHPDMTAYRFEITNLSTMTVQTIESSTNYFQLTDLSEYTYMTNYAVRVEMQRLGIWLGYYGNACTITTPSLFSGPSAIVIPECGTTLPDRYSPIFVTGPSFCSMFEARITNLTDPLGPNAVQSIVRTVPWFTLKMLTQYDYSTTYAIEVRVKTTGDYSAWTAPCNVSTPAAPPIAGPSPTVVSAELRAVSYPNPYTDVFTINMNTGNKERIQIKVYDMLGNLREARDIAADQVGNLQLGSDFVTGVYNVIVTQGDTVQSLRVMKR